MLFIFEKPFRAIVHQQLILTTILENIYNMFEFQNVENKIECTCPNPEFTNPLTNDEARFCLAESTVLPPKTENRLSWVSFEQPHINIGYERKNYLV